MSEIFRPIPSPIVAESLKQSAQYGTPENVAPGVSVVLADNPKDYTGPGTNCYVAGDDRVWIIDPGPACDTHISAVMAAVAGRPVDGIFVTHTHLDHSPAAAPLAKLTGAKTYGFGRLSSDILALTDEDVDPDFDPDVALGCGGTVGSGAWQIQALHTPGHFPNHMCYLLPAQHILFSGDHVMGWSTTVVVPPLGNLAEYMESLDKIRACDAALMMPSHGPVISSPAERVAEIRHHRRMRHRQVAECVAQGITDPKSIVDLIYEGLTPRLLTAAEGCVEAHLEQLADEGASAASAFLGNPIAAL